MPGTAAARSDDPLHPIRVGAGRAEREQAAVGSGHDRRSLEFERVEHLGDQVVGIGLHRAELGQTGCASHRFAEAASGPIQCDASKARETSEETRPTGAAVDGAVDEQHRRPVTRLLDPHRRSRREGDEAFRRRHPFRIPEPPFCGLESGRRFHDENVRRFATASPT